MELRTAIDWGDMKAFYDGLKVVCGPRDLQYSSSFP